MLKTHHFRVVYLHLWIVYSLFQKQKFHFFYRFAKDDHVTQLKLGL
jgi:hypothetical protein